MNPTRLMPMISYRSSCIGEVPRLEKKYDVVVCCLRIEDPKVLFMRADSIGVGDRAVKTGDVVNPST